MWQSDITQTSSSSTSQRVSLRKVLRIEALLGRVSDKVNDKDRIQSSV